MLTASTPYANSILQHRCKFMTQFTSGSIRRLGVNSWRNSGHIQFTCGIITCLGVNTGALIQFWPFITVFSNSNTGVSYEQMTYKWPTKKNIQCIQFKLAAQTGSSSCFYCWLSGSTSGSWDGSVTGVSTSIASSCGVSKAATDSKNSLPPLLSAQHGAHRELWASLLSLSC